MISLSKKEIAPFYANYLALVNKEISIIEGLNFQLYATVSYFQSIPIDKLEFKYAIGKWTIKDIFLHLIDTERIFAYRALRITRNDATELPGFNEDDYVFQANAANRAMNSIIEEYICKKSYFNFISKFYKRTIVTHR
jgi:hypothetical protein